MAIPISRWIVAWLAFAAAALAQDHQTAPQPAAPPLKPDCTLKRAVTVDMISERDGGFAIPVGVNGKDGQMIVDTGSIFSVFSETEARGRGIEIKPSNQLLVYLGGVPVYNMVELDNFSIGGLTGHNVNMMVAPDRVLNHDAIGMLGPDILSHYDVDIDFAQGKFSLFENSHCPGQVVYWTHQPYARVPISLDNGHIIVPVTLDGKQVSAAIDTGAERSTMSLGLAHELFGIDANSPGMKAIGPTRINGTRSAALYRYPFQALNFEGVTVQTPVIDILDGKRFEAGKNLMILGVKTLRQLHVYIAYDEAMLYLTAAEAR